MRNPAKALISSPCEHTPKQFSRRCVREAPKHGAIIFSQSAASSLTGLNWRHHVVGARTGDETASGARSSVWLADASGGTNRSLCGTQDPEWTQRGSDRAQPLYSGIEASCADRVNQPLQRRRCLLGFNHSRSRGCYLSQRRGGVRNCAGFLHSIQVEIATIVAEMLTLRRSGQPDPARTGRVHPE